MISVENISKSFNGVPAVKNISFEVKENETLVLLGTSGCGKTTTLRIINRLTEPDSGNIIINGKNVLSQQPDELRRGIGYVLQNHGLFPHYTTSENISIVPKLLNWDKEKIKQRTNELLKKLQLSEGTWLAFPNELSGGQQQRVGLARALAVNPPILLMDEPFGALDPITKADIHKEFKELDELKKKTIVLVTHDVQEAFELGDRICLMDKGEIMQIGTPFELLFTPANDYVKSFFDKHRLQLEFKSIQLSKVLSYFPLAQSSNKNILLSTQSLWEAMDMIANSDEKVFVKDELSEDTREINFSLIEKALNSFKQNQ
ncbi:MAG: ATP-binding cassette domain-containing protein [Ignavibacteria bacterium]|nr:ATP-binding cassette domain-containing protein [Ignavibacteria bacterium]